MFEARGQQRLREEAMKCSLRRILTLLSTVLIFTSFGAQYSKWGLLSRVIIILIVSAHLHAAVVLPTVWDYLSKRFKAEHWVYSLSVTGASLTNVFAGPMLGAVYDKTHACKLLVLTAIAFAVSGKPDSKERTRL